MTITEVIVAEAEATCTTAERLFRRVSDDELAWRPSAGKNWMSMGQLLMHCASFGCGKAVHAFVTGDWGPGAEDSTDHVHVPPADALPTVKTVGEALEILADDRRLTVKSIQSAGEMNLLDRNVAAPWGGPQMPLLQQLLRMISHLSQHKGQLFYYLKLMGKDVKTGDLWAG